MNYWRNLTFEYLEKEGVKEDLTDISRLVKPMTLSESASFFAKRFNLNKSAGEIAGEMIKLMNRHYRFDIPLKRGAEKLLKKLQGDGVRMCVASATDESLVKKCLKRLGVISYFDFILSCETLKTDKLRPEIFLEAAKKFGANPSGVAVYEDALYAMITAKNAGFYVVSVFDGDSKYEMSQILKISDEFLSLD